MAVSSPPSHVRPARRARPSGFLPMVFAAGVSFGMPQGAGDDRFVVDPYVRDVGTTHIEVAWETSAPHGTAVRYGTDIPLVLRRETPGTSAFHRVVLDGLEPGTRYLVQVVASAEDPSGPCGEVTQIRTAPRPGGALTFAVVGDTQDQPWVWERVAERIREEHPDFLVHCGDIVGDGLSSRAWRDEFFRPARRLLASIPTFAVLGNHEADSPAWYRYFGSEDRGWRSTHVYGDVQLFLVDSERPLEPGSEQHRWLDQALASSIARWRFVVVHRPPITSDHDDYGDALVGPTLGGDPRVQPLIPLLEAHDVDIVFFGHIHAYERSWPLRQGRVDRERGVTYVQTGGGGGRLEDAAPTRSPSTAKLRRCHHYCTVAIEGDHLELRAYDETGGLFDQMTRTCRSRGAQGNEGRPVGGMATLGR